MWRVLVTALKEFSLNTSFHALKYIAQDERTWIERIFWICCVTLSWYTSSLLIASSIDSFSNNPISLGVETSYLEWNTNFPSVVVCETSGDERVVDQHFEDLFNAKYELVDEEDTRLKTVIKGVVFFQGNLDFLFFCYKDFGEKIMDTNVGCPAADFISIVNYFRRNCTQLFKKCMWFGKEFDCCTYFLELPTEYGTCYAINNLNTKIQRRFRMISNYSSGPGSLQLHLLGAGNMVYLLSNEMVPTLNIKKEDTVKINVNISAKMHIKVNEIKNGDAVEEVSIDKRQCRFPDENNLKVYPIYSPAGCIVNCRKDLQLKYCNCTSYFMPNVDPSLHCELEGMVCLDEFYNEYAIQKPKWSDKSTGFYCPCEEGCNTESIEQVMSTLETTKEISSSAAELEVALDHLPTELFKRTVVRGKLDLVVSIGGAAGLFVGASLLSFIEFFYFFTVRLFVTMRRLNPTKDTKKKDENKTVEVKPVEKPPETAATSKKTQFPFKPVYEPNVYYTLPPAKPYYKSIHKL